jgi:hypothetical protein
MVGTSKIYRTSQDITTSCGADKEIKVPKGTLLSAIGNNNFAVADGSVLSQQNDHDRKYRYVTVPNEFVVEG